MPKPNSRDTAHKLAQRELKKAHKLAQLELKLERQLKLKASLEKWISKLEAERQQLEEQQLEGRGHVRRSQ
jgi:hypothetical protein